MITGFQLRAAIAATKLFTKEISQLVNVHEITLLRLKRTPNLEYLNCHTQNLVALITFFEKRNIIFPERNTIKLINTNNLSNVIIGITRFQLVTARTAMGLTQSELSFKIGISSGALSLLENLENNEFIYNKKLKTSLLIKFFEHAGIIFKDNCSVTLIKDSANLFNKNKKVN